MKPNEQQERRIRKRDEANPTTHELRAVFHRLWTSQVGQRGYSKRDWRELRQLIFRKFGVEV